MKIIQTKGYIICKLICSHFNREQNIHSCQKFLANSPYCRKTLSCQKASFCLLFVKTFNYQKKRVCKQEIFWVAYPVQYCIVHTSSKPEIRVSRDHLVEPGEQKSVISAQTQGKDSNITMLIGWNIFNQLKKEFQKYNLMLLSLCLSESIVQQLLVHWKSKL